MAYFWNKDEQPIPLQGVYSGCSLFMVWSGPSLKTLNLDLLRQPGIITMGVNNSPMAFRPNLWVSVDDPANFAISIWRDPLIHKFVMLGKRDKQLWDNNRWADSPWTVQECPNITYYRDNEHFKATDEFLTEETINWGNHTARCEQCGAMRSDKLPCHGCGGKLFGARTVMLAAVKLAYVLGFRKVFLLGADFKMEPENTYAWKQDKGLGGIRNNNKTYERMCARFAALRPVFERNNFFVFNATPNSGLTAFPKISYTDALNIALTGFPNTKNERTYGMYERKGIDRDIEKRHNEQLAFTEAIKKLNGSDGRQLKRLKHKLEVAIAKHRTALETREKILTWKD